RITRYRCLTPKVSDTLRESDTTPRIARYRCLNPKVSDTLRESDTTPRIAHYRHYRCLTPKVSDTLPLMPWTGLGFRRRIEIIGQCVELAGHFAPGPSNCLYGFDFRGAERVFLDAVVNHAVQPYQRRGRTPGHRRALAATNNLRHAHNLLLGRRRHFIQRRAQAAADLL